MFTVNFSVEFFGLSVKAREPLGAGTEEDQFSQISRNSFRLRLEKKTTLQPETFKSTKIINLRVGDVESAVNSALQGSENSCTCTGFHETNVEVAPESARTLVQVFNDVFITVNFGLSFVEPVQTKLSQELRKNNGIILTECMLIHC